MTTTTKPTRQSRPRLRRPRLPDIWEDWQKGGGSIAGGEDAQLRYYVDPQSPAGPDVERHVVSLRFPWNLDRQTIHWRFTTVESARVAWGEARLYLTALGFERVAD